MSAMKPPEFPAKMLAVGPQQALLKAVETWLRRELNDKPDSPTGELVGIHTSGKPAKIGGAWYFSIHSPTWANRSKETNYVSLQIGFTVTLSVRRSYVPKDREGTALVAGEANAFNIMDWIGSEEGLHGNYAVQADANALISLNAPTQGQGFHKPAVAGMMSSRDVGPDWFGATPKAAQEFGYVIDLTFVGAEFIRGK